MDIYQLTFKNNAIIFTESPDMKTSLSNNKDICNLTNCGDAIEALNMENIANVVSVIVPIIFTIIVIIGLIGNALVVIVVLCNPTMRSTTNLLIINLAIADLLFIVFCVPFTGCDYALSYWPFGDIWCRIVQYLILVCAYASIYTLVLMSLDRFLAVVHPIQSISIRTQRNAYLAISVLWVTILIICIPALILHRVESYQTLQGKNTENNIEKKSKNTSNFERNETSVCSTVREVQELFQLSFFFTSYVIPLTIAFVLYMLMLKRLWFGNVPGGGHMSVESVKCKKRVTRLVVVVVVIFAVCWGPIQVVLALKSIERYSITPLKLIIQIVSHVLAYINSCINPILYAFLSENFRKAFRKVIVCNNNNSTNNNITKQNYKNNQQTKEYNMNFRTSLECTINEISCHSKITKFTNGNV